MDYSQSNTFDYLDIAHDYLDKASAIRNKLQFPGAQLFTETGLLPAILLNVGTSYTYKV